MAEPTLFPFQSQGLALHGVCWEPDLARPRGLVLLVHGFNSSLREFGPLGQALADAGFVALAFDQRGYGKSGGEPGRTSVEGAVADIDAAARALGERHPGIPMGIVGHSLGGAYAVAALGRLPHFSAGVAAHPVDRLFDELAPHERLAYHVIGRLAERRMRKGRAPGSIPYRNSYASLFVSRDAAAAAAADGFLLGRVSLANYRPALTMSGATWAKAVTAPVLVLASPHDKAVKPAHTRAVYEALAGPKEWLTHRGGHSCFRDLDGALLCSAAVGWMERHLGTRA